ncbi:TRAP transporter substrate-binding protein [Oceanibacterium hippocampi]|uniref:2,3-diketo-L-gulonate-binding periplasmic protein YiaO n=1 Tax=Oceanibacterium hippocampi TaxID=745714 RepID=A0A1Y5TJE0_9PROT|nr:TRAP transporter substrate-binding protein [Oceanibacterium hippocampi]SLN65517.1 2,3-diketo-L-gulonate-binding periplasmic protein YiaO precursor [Oceanibacterium hippocampi]
MNKKKLLTATLAALAGSFVWAGISNAETRTLQLAHVSVEKPDDMYHYLAVAFAAGVKEQSGGAIAIDVLGGAQLGGERQVAEGLQLGTIDMSLLGSFTLGNFEPKAMVFDLPYLFPTYDAAFKAMDSEFTAPIEDNLEGMGLKVLGWGHGGFRNLYNSKGPVRSLADMASMKVRIPETPVYVDTWRALGVNATSMAYPEVFTGLQQGTIDGGENPTLLYLSSHFYEAAKYLSKTEHVYVSIPLVVSGSVWSSLSDKEKAILQAAADQAVAAQRKFLVSGEGEAEKRLAEAGVTIVSDVDKAEFKKAVAPVYDRYADALGADLIEQAKQFSK